MCGPDRFSVLKQPTIGLVRTQINTAVLLQYRDGPVATLPSALLHVAEDGAKYVKIRPSHWAITKLILGHIPESKACKHPTLANSTKMQELQTNMSDALHALLSKSDEKESEDYFEQGGKQKDKSKQLKPLSLAPSTLTLQVNDVSVRLATPSSLKDKDLTVALQADMLTAVCDFICQDLSLVWSFRSRHKKKVQCHWQVCQV